MIKPSSLTTKINRYGENDVFIRSKVVIANIALRDFSVPGNRDLASALEENYHNIFYEMYGDLAIEVSELRSILFDHGESSKLPKEAIDKIDKIANMLTPTQHINAEISTLERSNS